MIKSSSNTKSFRALVNPDHHSFTSFTNASTHKKRDRSGTCPFRLSKKSKDFSDSLKNAVTFPPLRGGKVLAALAERLAKQGIQGI